MKKSPAIIVTAIGAAVVIGYITHVYGMGPGMMGGRGMMSRSSNDQTSPAATNPKVADALLAYIRSNNLTCTQCHGISANGVGPSFAVISANYANRTDAESVLADHIEHGFGRMPGGMANSAKSARIANLILNLTKPDSK